MGVSLPQARGSQNLYRRAPLVALLTGPGADVKFSLLQLENTGASPEDL